MVAGELIPAPGALPAWWGPRPEPEQLPALEVEQLAWLVEGRAVVPVADALRGPAAGRYLLHEELGRSRWAVVFRAIDRLLLRAVVVKVFRDEQDFGEARWIAEVKHEHIVEVHDVGTYQGHAYMVLEWCEEGDLATWSRDQSWREIVERIVEVGRALEHCHAMDVVHGDVKPANVLISEGRAHLADFGLADRPASVEEVGGTLGYMAPELGLGQRTPAADVYALAATAWFCLFEALPYSGRTTIAMWEHALEGPPAEPARRPPGCPPELLEHIATGLHADPSLRPRLSSWLDALEALRRPQLQPPRPRSYRTWIGGVLGALMLASVAHSAQGACVEPPPRAEVRRARVVALAGQARDAAERANGGAAVSAMDRAFTLSTDGDPDQLEVLAIAAHDAATALEKHGLLEDALMIWAYAITLDRRLGREAELLNARAAILALDTKFNRAKKASHEPGFTAVPTQSK
ncbi:serine/threonine-protein kinase [Plesiocystis pacifica]|uniref:serine/threonine-protein kinase n=1 Tax=Plesiocystis pacifica TaxID=191768 RepID=UPI0012F78F82|nr:serine/threonine-protein kinase [Plesiocystis pacifica]